jgi:hypothetical protein
MIRRPTWITLGVFVALLSFAVYWTLFRSEESNSEVTPTLEPLWSALPSDIVGIKIEDLDTGKSIELQKDADDAWNQLTPIQGPVETEFIVSTIDWLAAPVPKREFLIEGDLTQFGLSEPNGKITVNLTGGAEHVLLIGDDNVIGSMTYVMLSPSSKVLLMNKLDVDSTLELVDILLPPTPEESTLEAIEIPEESTPESIEVPESQ